MREVNVCAIWANTGARTTIRNTGRINRMIGKSILVPSFSISDSTFRRPLLANRLRLVADDVDERSARALGLRKRGREDREGRHAGSLCEAKERLGSR